MIPVTNRHGVTLANGRREIWGAESRDAVWRFEREESPGTPWIVTNVHVPGWWAIFNSLPKARAGAERALGWDLCNSLVNVLGNRPTPAPMRLAMA